MNTVNKAEIINQLISSFWTAIGFLPVVVYWYVAGISIWFYVYLTMSMLFILLPKQALNLLQISKDTVFYERLGIRIVRKYVQHGDHVNRLQKMALKSKRFVNKSNPGNYLKTIVMYERFHYMCCIFFIFSAVSAILRLHITFAFFIILSNIIYNIVPILLQQYNRLRILRLLN